MSQIIRKYGWEEIVKGLLTLAELLQLLVCRVSNWAYSTSYISFSRFNNLTWYGIAAIGAGALLLSLALPALSIGLVALSSSC